MGFSLRHSVAHPLYGTETFGPWHGVSLWFAVMLAPEGTRSDRVLRPNRGWWLIMMFLRRLSELNDLSGGGGAEQGTDETGSSPKRVPSMLGVSEMSVPQLVSATATGFPLELRVPFNVEPANSARYGL